VSKGRDEENRLNPKRKGTGQETRVHKNDPRQFVVQPDSNTPSRGRENKREEETKLPLGSATKIFARDGKSKKNGDRSVLYSETLRKEKEGRKKGKGRGRSPRECGARYRRHCRALTSRKTMGTRSHFHKQKVISTLLKGHLRPTTKEGKEERKGLSCVWC